MPPVKAGFRVVRFRLSYLYQAECDQAEKTRYNFQKALVIKLYIATNAGRCQATSALFTKFRRDYGSLRCLVAIRFGSIFTYNFFFIILNHKVEWSRVEDQRYGGH